MYDKDYFTGRKQRKGLVRKTGNNAYLFIFFYNRIDSIHHIIIAAQNLVLAMLMYAICLPSWKDLPTSVMYSPIIAQSVPDVQGTWILCHRRETPFIHFNFFIVWYTYVSEDWILAFYSNKQCNNALMCNISHVHSIPSLNEKVDWKEIVISLWN